MLRARFGVRLQRFTDQNIDLFRSFELRLGAEEILFCELARPLCFRMFGMRLLSCGLRTISGGAGGFEANFGLREPFFCGVESFERKSMGICFARAAEILGERRQ